MKEYKITIRAERVGEYNADSIEDANEIAQSECDDIYARLRGRCSVEIESVEEVLKKFEGGAE